MVDSSLIKAKKYQPNKDKSGELIKSMDYTPGTGHDSNCFSTLLDCDQSAVYVKRLNRLQSATR